MPSQEGLRVVRGPDWKWGDQDGGIGHAGTVIPTSEYDKKKMGPRTVTVLWDCGKKGVYQGGPNGSHHLRVIDNTYLGVKHTNIPCEDDSCWVQEILGTRWQCTTCGINLCTNCFLKKVPHNVEHTKFRRFTSNEEDAKPSIVRCWGADGPDSRIELKGFYPGATVYMGPEWPYRREEETKRGLVVAAPKDEVSGKILVEWHPSKERTRHQRSSSDGHSDLKLKEPGISGYYYPEALAAVEADVADVSPRSAFSVGDRVQIDPSLKKNDIRRMQVDHGGYAGWLKDYIRTVGTVESVDESSVKVRFKDDHGICHQYTSWRFNPAILIKLNKFSIGQIIRIRNDECTIQSIKSKFIQTGIHQKLIGAIGRVVDVNENDPSRIYVQFDDNEIYRWLSNRAALPSAWMEHFGLEDLAVEQEIAESIKKTVSLFFNAVDRGDLSNGKIFHLHHTIVGDARNANGESALHVACIRGHKDITEWLIDDVKVDIETPSKIGYRPIHYAVRQCNPGILGLLIERGVDVDSQTTNSKCTALHIAAMHNHTECIQLLIDGECDANIQDKDGNTPLHYAIYTGNSLCVSQILSRVSINFELRSNMGFNVFHVAVVKGDLKAIELMMEQENMDDPLLEFMPDSKSTVLHYASTHKHYQVAKLLVTRSTTKSMPNGSSLLKNLLEVKNESNITALQIACKLKNPALIELLVEAGANCEVLDEENNTSILLAASSSAEDMAPTQELCPSIFKIYQRLENDSGLKDAENKTLLSLILFLMSKGCCVKAVNKNGIKLSAILLPDKGYPKNTIKLLTQFFQNSKRGPSSGSGGCMGRTSCSQQPVYQLSCPHKAIYKACSLCFLPTADSFKCGCPEEKIVSISTAASSSSAEVSSSVQTRVKEERNQAEEIVFKWLDDGTKNGKVEDDIGNTYLRCGTRMDGGIGYRCLALSAVGRNGRCTAVVRRYINDGSDNIYLELHHTKHNQDDKCEHPEEGILPIPNCSQAEFSSPIEGTRIYKEEQTGYEFKWVSDGSKNGKIEDQIGNEYIWSGTRKDGGIGYRCCNLIGRKSRCTAVARRFLKSNQDGTDKILLESPHHHAESKRKLDCVNDQDGDPSIPSAKKKRSSVNAAKY